MRALLWFGVLTTLLLLGCRGDQSEAVAASPTIPADTTTALPTTPAPEPAPATSPTVSRTARPFAVQTPEGYIYLRDPYRSEAIDRFGTLTRNETRPLGAGSDTFNGWVERTVTYREGLALTYLGANPADMYLQGIVVSSPTYPLGPGLKVGDKLERLQQLYPRQFAEVAAGGPLTMERDDYRVEVASTNGRIQQINIIYLLQ